MTCLVADDHPALVEAVVAVLEEHDMEVVGRARDEEIGKELFISPATVRTYVRNAMDKLDADTRTQAVAKALRGSLIA